MAKRKGNAKEEREVRRIRKPIDEARRAELAYDMAHVTNDIIHQRDEKAAEMKVFNDHIKELEARLRRLATDVVEGKEDVEVETFVLRDFETNTVSYLDVRTGERFDSRAMTEDERGKLAQLTFEDADVGRGIVEEGDGE